MFKSSAGIGGASQPGGSKLLRHTGKCPIAFTDQKSNVRRMSGCYQRICLPIPSRLLSFVVAAAELFLAYVASVSTENTFYSCR
ncbi:hypothetical protein EMIT0P253_180111 [Pseudomonas sp. IT-P253]